MWVGRQENNIICKRTNEPILRSEETVLESSEFLANLNSRSLKTEMWQQKREAKALEADLFGWNRKLLKSSASTSRNSKFFFETLHAEAVFWHTLLPLVYLTNSQVYSCNVILICSSN